MHRKLIQPLPPFINKADPMILAWRQDKLEEALEHIHQSKTDIQPEPTSGLWLRTLLLLLTWFLGVIGLASPELVAKLLRALLL
jgi:hypothetical protein